MNLQREKLVKSIRPNDELLGNIITDLSRVDYESKHFFHKGQRQNGSGIWILKDRDFLRWVNGSKLTGPTNWLWLKGDGGSGKTTLTYRFSFSHLFLLTFSQVYRN